jgi:hypothetical protein
MPRRRKRAEELPTEEALRKLFPKRVRDEAKKAALETQKKLSKKDST